MFPCGHVYFSMMSSGSRNNAQLLGAILPDVATTGVVGWQDLHDIARVDEFENIFRGDASFASVIHGIRHHIELDERAHHSWRGNGGFAYERQTQELQASVAAAFGVEGELARTLAHNVVETACDIHLVDNKPDVFGALRASIEQVDVEPIVHGLAMWTDADVSDVRSKVGSFLSIWSNGDPSGVDGMVDIWKQLIECLKCSTFRSGELGGFDESRARNAIEIALNLTSDDYLEVLTP